MSKTTASFKLKKEAKRLLATIVDPHERGVTKRLLIDSQVAAAMQYKPSKKKEQEPEGE